MSKTCADCQKPLRYDPSPVDSICGACYDYAGYENHHSDEDHDGPCSFCIDTECPICLDLPIPAYTPRTRPGSTSSAPRSWSSHAGCKHDRTPKARAECRKRRG